MDSRRIHSNPFANEVFHARDKSRSTVSDHVVPPAGGGGGDGGSSGSSQGRQVFQAGHGQISGRTVHGLIGQIFKHSMIRQGIHLCFFGLHQLDDLS